MVQATKDFKNKLNNNLPLLDKLLSHNRVGKYAQLLKNAQPRIVSKNAVVFESKFNSTAVKMNYKENQLGFSKVVEALFNESCIILCISQGEYVEAVRKFTNLQQANKLPTPKPVEIDTKTKQTSNYVSKTESLADELFK